MVCGKVGGAGQPDAEDTAATGWADLVGRIQHGDESAVGELYQAIVRGIRFYLSRRVQAENIDDKTQEIIWIVIDAIKRGTVREPERLMGFVRTVAQRVVATYIDEAVRRRERLTDLPPGLDVPDTAETPEELASRGQRQAFCVAVLGCMSTRDKEILTRFYLREQTTAEICQAMDLTETQFRIMKSRAKARFGELGKNQLHQHGMRRQRSKLFVSP